MSRLILPRMLIVLLTGAALTAAAAVAQTTWYVDDDAPGDPGPGDPLVSDPAEDGSAEHPFDAIQEGIYVCQHGDTVLVLDGTYTGSLNKDLDFGGLAITLRSENGPQNCVIDCEDDGRAFVFRFGERLDSVVDGFTLRRGDAPAYGGGAVFCYNGSSPTISNCVITQNTAFNLNGGGMYCLSGSDARVVHSTFAGNSANLGGGIAVEFSNVVIVDCTFSENFARYGGAVFPYMSDLAIINCTITNNNATGPAGGGIRSTHSVVRITNCTIAENTAAHDGGGIHCWETRNSAIINCTFSENSASDHGGAICCDGNSSLAVTNSILWGDSAAGGPEIAVLGFSDVMLSYGDIDGAWPEIEVPPGSMCDWSEGNIFIDPLFVDPDTDDYHLMAGSPCVDAGCNWAVPPDTADLDGDGDTDEITPFDLDAEGRFFDDPDTADTGCGNPPIVDMGAYEFGGTCPQPCLGDLDDDREVDLGDLATLLAHYGEDETCEGDLDCDGDVDLSDLSALLAAYGTTCE